MTEEHNTPDENTEDASPADELKMLKERAKTMGIPLGGNVGVDALKRKIEAKLAGSQEETAEETEEAEEPQTGEPEAAAEMAQPKAPRAAPKPLTKAEREQAIRQRMQREEMALVRCRIYNLDPGKRDLRGEFVCVANR